MIASLLLRYQRFVKTSFTLALLLHRGVEAGPSSGITTHESIRIGERQPMLQSCKLFSSVTAREPFRLLSGTTFAFGTPAGTLNPSPMRVYVDISWCPTLFPGIFQERVRRSVPARGHALR